MSTSWPSADQIENILARVLSGDLDYSKAYFVDGVPWTVDEWSRRSWTTGLNNNTISVSYSTGNGMADAGTRIVQVGNDSGTKNVIRINGNWVDYSTVAGVMVTGSTAEAAKPVTVEQYATPVVIAPALPSAPVPPTPPTSSGGVTSLGGGGIIVEPVTMIGTPVPIGDPTKPVSPLGGLTVTGPTDTFERYGTGGLSGVHKIGDPVTVNPSNPSLPVVVPDNGTTPTTNQPPVVATDIIGGGNTTGTTVPINTSVPASVGGTIKTGVPTPSPTVQGGQSNKALTFLALGLGVLILAEIMG